MKTIKMGLNGFAAMAFLIFSTTLGIHSISAAETYTGEAWSQGQPCFYLDGKPEDNNCHVAARMAYESALLQCRQDGNKVCKGKGGAKTFFQNYGCGDPLTICYMSEVFEGTK